MNITILKIALLFQDLPWLYYCVYLYYIFVLLYKLSHKYINILYAYIITRLEHVFVCDQQTISQVISYQLTATYLSSLICHGPCCFFQTNHVPPLSTGPSLMIYVPLGYLTFSVWIPAGQLSTLFTYGYGHEPYIDLGFCSPWISFWCAEEISD